MPGRPDPVIPRRKKAAPFQQPALPVVQSRKAGGVAGAAGAKVTSRALPATQGMPGYVKPSAPKPRAPKPVAVKPAARPAAPVRAVAPVVAPKAPKAKAARPVAKPRVPAQQGGGGGAGLYGGLGPAGYVNQVYGPQEQILSQQQAQRQQALQSLLADFRASLSDVGSQLAPYTAAASQQSSDAAHAAASLAAANPNAVTQNDLAAVNAPQAQQAQVAGSNQAAFGGNAALLGYTGGTIPADQFKADAAGRAAFLAALPAIGESLGVRGTNALSNLSSTESLQLQTQKANALMQARQALADYTVKNQSNRISQAAVLGNLLGYVPKGVLGNDAPITTVSGYNATTSRTRAANAQTNADRRYRLQVAEYGLSKARLKSQLRKDLATAATKGANHGLTQQRAQSYRAQALGLARIAHKPTSDGHPPVTWQQFLDGGLNQKVPMWILIEQGKRVYSQDEIRNGLIPAGG